MQKKLLNVGVAVAVVLVVAGIAWKSIHQNKKASSAERVSEIYKEVEPLKAEWVELYQKRFELMQTWAKQSGIKLPPTLQTAPKNELKTDIDFAVYDQFQMQVTNQLSAMLANKELIKRIKELEKIEEQINRKRSAYHAPAFEADELIKNFNTGQALIPVFKAEQYLHDHQK